jgi:hypothetical protein
MLRGGLSALVRRYDVWLVLQVVLGMGLTTVTVTLAVELLRPVRVTGKPTGVAPPRGLMSTDELLAGLQARETTSNRIASAMRAGLFRSATPLSDKPIADKTIERIRSQLTLQCIMRVNGELVAYVNVTNSGLKKCRVGDAVEDLFTVVGIGEKSIELTIVDHPVTLSL